MKLFTIRDQKGTGYSPPFVATTTGQAERQFNDLIQDPQSQIAKYPADFSLHYLGEYNESTGEIIASQPNLVIEAIALKTANIT